MHLKLETDIAAPADDVWRVLGIQFADIDNWSTFVKTSRTIEASEVPPSFTVAETAPVAGRETSTKATLIEVLTDYSNRDRSLTFHGVGVPKVVKRARNVQSVREVDANRSTVVFEVDFDFVGPLELLGPLVKRRMEKTFSEVQTDLKRYVEAA